MSFLPYRVRTLSSPARRSNPRRPQPHPVEITGANGLDRRDSASSAAMRRRPVKAWDFSALAMKKASFHLANQIGPVQLPNDWKCVSFINLSQKLCCAQTCVSSQRVDADCTLNDRKKVTLERSFAHTVVNRQAIICAGISMFWRSQSTASACRSPTVTE